MLEGTPPSLAPRSKVFGAVLEAQSIPPAMEGKDVATARAACQAFESSRFESHPKMLATVRVKRTARAAPGTVAFEFHSLASEVLRRPRK